MGRMTVALPLSERVIIVLLSWSLVLNQFIVLCSGCVLFMGLGLLFGRNVFMRSATNYL
jgi:hypothetical protein